MNCLFIHDFRAYHNNGNFYSVDFPDELWERYYLPLFGNIRICNRSVEVDLNTVTGLNLFNNPKIQIANNLPYKRTTDLIFNKNAIDSILENEIQKADAVIIRMPSFLGVSAIKACRKYKRLYLVEVVACPWDSFWNWGALGKVVAPYMWYITRKYIKDAPYVKYVTNGFLQTRYPCLNKSAGISDVIIENESDDILTKRCYKIKNWKNGDVLTLGSIGAVNQKYKGYQFVIRAIAKLKSEFGIKVHYRLVGGGEQIKLRKLSQSLGVEELIEFVGSLPHKDIFNWLDSIDVYIQPSLVEGLPRSLIEAMSRAVPCIGSNAGGIPELLSKDATYSNTENIVKQIVEKIKNINLEWLYSQAQYNYDKSLEYNSDYLTEKTLSFYGEYKKDQELFQRRLF